MMSSENIETRTRILEASWKLLEADSGGGVRMSDIAKKSGISRQAVYLHFPSRADLLVATTHYIDEVKDVDKRLAKSRAAKSGEERLEAFIDAWGNYIPEIYGVATALMAMQDSDNEAALAWDDRMQAVRQGCERAVKALAKDGVLSSSYSQREATDILWTLLSVRNWEQLRHMCGWSQQSYIKEMKKLARQMLLGELG